MTPALAQRMIAITEDVVKSTRMRHSIAKGYIANKLRLSEAKENIGDQMQ